MRTSSARRGGGKRPVGVVKRGAFSEKHSGKVLRGIAVAPPRTRKPQPPKQDGARSKGRRAPLSQVNDEYLKLQTIRNLPRVQDPAVDEMLSRYSSEVRRQAHDSLVTSRLMDDILDNSGVNNNDLNSSDVSMEVQHVIADTIDSFVAKAKYSLDLDDSTDDGAGDVQNELVDQLKTDIEHLLLEAGVDGLENTDIDNLLSGNPSDDREAAATRSAIVSRFAGDSRGEPSPSNTSEQADIAADSAAADHPDPKRQHFSLEEKLAEVEDIFYGNERREGRGSTEPKDGDGKADQQLSDTAKESQSLAPVFRQFDEILRNIPDPWQRNEERQAAELREQHNVILRRSGKEQDTDRSRGARGNDKQTKPRLFMESYKTFEGSLRAQKPGVPSPKLAKRLRQTAGERYRSYHRQCVRRNASVDPKDREEILSFDKWREKTEAEEAAHAQEQAKRAQKRYQALRRRHAQGKKHQNKKQATTNSTSGEANSFANMTARDVELALVDSEKALQKVNDEVQRLAADRRRKRKEIAAGKKSIKAMADTLRQLVPLAAKLGAELTFASTQRSSTALPPRVKEAVTEGKKTIQSIISDAMDDDASRAAPAREDLREFIGAKFEGLSSALKAMGNVFHDIERSNDTARTRLAANDRLTEVIGDGNDAVAASAINNTLAADRDFRRNLMSALVPDKFATELDGYDWQPQRAAATENSDIRKQSFIRRSSNIGGHAPSVGTLRSTYEEDSLDGEEVDGFEYVSDEGGHGDDEHEFEHLLDGAETVPEDAVDGHSSVDSNDHYSSIVRQLSAKVGEVVDIDDQVASLDASINNIQSDLMMQPMQFLDMEVEMSNDEDDGADAVGSTQVVGTSSAPAMHVMEMEQMPSLSMELEPYEPLDAPEGGSASYLDEEIEEEKTYEPTSLPIPAIEPSSKVTLQEMRAASPKRGQRSGAHFGAKDQAGDVSESLLEAPEADYFQNMRESNDFFRAAQSKLKGQEQQQ